MCVCEMKICGCGRASADGQIAPPRDKLYAWNEFKRARKDRGAQGEGETKQRARASGRRARSCTVVAADHQARGIKLQDRKLGGGGAGHGRAKFAFQATRLPAESVSAHRILSTCILSTRPKAFALSCRRFILAAMQVLAECRGPPTCRGRATRPGVRRRARPGPHLFPGLRSRRARVRENRLGGKRRALRGHPCSCHAHHDRSSRTLSITRIRGGCPGGPRRIHRASMDLNGARATRIATRQNAVDFTISVLSCP